MSDKKFDNARLNDEELDQVTGGVTNSNTQYGVNDLVQRDGVSPVTNLVFQNGMERNVTNLGMQTQKGKKSSNKKNGTWNPDGQGTLL